MRKIDIIQYGGNILFVLLLFCFAADPTNAIFHAKDIAFLLLIAYNLIFLQAKWNKIIYFVMGEVAILIPYLIAVARGEYIDHDFAFVLVKSMAPLCLLPWIHHYDVLKLSQWPTVITACIVIILFWTIFFLPETELFIYEFMRSKDNTIMMANRSFLGKEIFCMNHKATASFLIILAVFFYRSITKDKLSWLSILGCCILINVFLITGSRMTMLFPFFTIGLILFHFYRDKRYYNYFIYPFLAIVGLCFFFLLYVLASEINEPSNLVKYAHLESYKTLFSENPLYLLFGQGPGARYYSMGFHRMTVQTEWTYIELVRYMGIFSFLIFFIFFYPLYHLYKKRTESDLAIVIFYAFAVYLLIAGTNPLLLSSTGMFSLLVVYSFLAKDEQTRA